MPKMSRPAVTNALAIDCEMVADKYGNNLLAQVAICNEKGQCIGNYYVKQLNVGDYRTEITGITEQRLETGMDFNKLQKKVSEMIRGRILVGHSLKHDLQVLKLTHPEEMKRDLACHFRTANGLTPSLKNLAQQYLGLTIQTEHHDAVKDARATMRIYKKIENQWDQKSGTGSVSKF